MKIVQVVALAAAVTAVAAGAVNAGLRRGAPLATESTAVTTSAADLAAKQAADTFLHFLVVDAQKGHDEKEKSDKKDDKKQEKKEDDKKQEKKEDDDDDDDDDDKKEKKENEKKEKKKKEEDEAEVEKNDFIADCLVHVGELVQRIDGSYTDVQFRTVLENECLLSKQFPLTYDDGFDSHKSCMSFAKKLTKARNHELADGSTKKYQKFCKKFYEKEVEPKRKKGKEDLEEELEKDVEEAEAFILSGNSTWLIVLVLACCLCGVLALVYQNRKSSRPQERSNRQ